MEDIKLGDLKIAMMSIILGVGIGYLLYQMETKQ